MGNLSLNHQVRDKELAFQAASHKMAGFEYVQRRSLKRVFESRV